VRAGWPKLRFGVDRFGAASIVAHHQPPLQSLSCAQSKSVQNAFASEGDVP
jgi:hypothetical protein